jgi:hypothetical protein
MKRIRDIGKKLPRIRLRGKAQPTINAEEVRRALGAEPYDGPPPPQGPRSKEKK